MSESAALEFEVASSSGPKLTFSQLPVELRLQCWEAALQQEAQNCLVFVHEHSRKILPTRRLCSALLSVNSESRRCALGFYTTQLPVRGHEPLEAGHYKLNVQERNLLYLNLEVSMFVLTTEITEWTRNHQEKMPDGPGPWTKSKPMITTPLTTSECARIKRLLVLPAFSRLSEREFNEYAEKKPWRFFKGDLFTGPEMGLYLRFKHDTPFLLNMLYELSQLDAGKFTEKYKQVLYEWHPEIQRYVPDSNYYYYQTGPSIGGGMFNFRPRPVNRS